MRLSSIVEFQDMCEDFGLFHISDALQHQLPLHSSTVCRYINNPNLYRSRNQPSEVARIVSLGVSFPRPCCIHYHPTSAILPTINIFIDILYIHFCPSTPFLLSLLAIRLI